MNDFLEVYSRTILLNGVDFEGQKSLSQSKILLIGAGGISSIVIPILTASGVAELAVWEPDFLELSNLQRQFIYKRTDVSKPKVLLASAFSKNLNPNVSFTAIQKELSVKTENEFYEFAKNYDVIIDGTDSFSSRVIANKTAVSISKPFFTASAIEFCGHIYAFAGFQPEMPCYSCVFGDNLNSFQDLKTCANSGVLPSLPSIVGSIMASQVLLFLLKKECDFSKFILVDFSKKTYFKEMVIKKDKKCKICC